MTTKPPSVSTVQFTIDDQNPNDTYAQLYSSSIVNIISNLKLARYGLAHYEISEHSSESLSQNERTILDNLSRGGQRLQVIEAIYRHPLRQTAIDTLNRQLRAGISNEDLAARVIELWKDGRLCIVEEERRTREPQIVCSLELRRRGL